MGGVEGYCESSRPSKSVLRRCSLNQYKAANSPLESHKECSWKLLKECESRLRALCSGIVCTGLISGDRSDATSVAIRRSPSGNRCSPSDVASRPHITLVK